MHNSTFNNVVPSVVPFSLIILLSTLYILLVNPGRITPTLRIAHFALRIFHLLH